MNRNKRVIHEARKKYGTKCYICGEEGAEMHHLIPLWMGGKDSVNNMIPLCTWHHMLMHKARSMRSNHEHAHTDGRPRTVVAIENYKDVLNDYLECRIGTMECCDRLGLSRKSHVRDAVWFKEYTKELGIVNSLNRVDGMNKGKKPGTIRGWVIYENGEKRVFEA